MRFPARCQAKSKIWEKAKLSSKSEKIELAKKVLEIQSKEFHMEQIKSKVKSLRKKFTTSNKGRKSKLCKLY